MNKSWDLNDALTFCRDLEPKLFEKAQAHCGFIGGVLHNGTSRKDLDVVIYPHKKSHTGPWNTSWVKGLLSDLLGAPLVDCNNATSGCYRDAKEVCWVRLPDGRRVDFFFLS